MLHHLALSIQLSALSMFHFFLWPKSQVQPPIYLKVLRIQKSPQPAYLPVGFPCIFPLKIPILSWIAPKLSYSFEAKTSLFALVAGENTINHGATPTWPFNSKTKELVCVQTQEAKWTMGPVSFIGITTHSTLLFSKHFSPTTLSAFTNEACYHHGKSFMCKA